MPYPQFDRGRLRILPLQQRKHDVHLGDFLDLQSPVPPLSAMSMQSLECLGRALAQARRRNAARILLIGAHVIRAGVARHLIDLMQRRLISHLALNGAGPIHDYELARIGATCESVAHYIRTGQFGLWHETGQINDIVNEGVEKGLGMGEAIGRAILEGPFPHKEISVLAAAVSTGIPVTVHIGIGHDILHEHPNFDPGAAAVGSYRDFLTFCHSVSQLEGGVFLCVGSAVTGPEVYLKALAMARNVAHQEGKQIARFTTGVFDLVPLPEDYHREAPRDQPQYYYRPWKTILVRTVADGGESYYVQGNHRYTIPHLRRYALMHAGDSPP